MKRLLGLLLAMGGCSAKTVDVTKPNPVTVPDSEAVGGDATNTVDEQNAALRDDFWKELNNATPFSETLAEKYGIGKTSSEPTFTDQKTLSEKKWDEEGNGIEK